MENNWNINSIPYLYLNKQDGTLQYKSNLYYFCTAIFFNLTKLLFLGNYYRSSSIKNLSKEIASYLDTQNKVSSLEKTSQFATLQKVEQIFQQYVATHSSLVKEQLHLKRHIHAFTYRSSYVQQHGKVDAETNSKIKKELISKAEFWKAKDKAFPQGEQSKLTDADKEAIQQLCLKYADMAELVLKSDELQLSFFRWVIQDQNDVDTFVLFPHIQESLSRSNMANCIGRMHNSGIATLRIVRTETGELDLTLPFQAIQEKESKEGESKAEHESRFQWKTRRISILDSNKRVELPGFYNKTIQQIFQSFQDQVTIDKLGDIQWSPVYRELEEKNQYNGIASEERECGGITAYDPLTLSANGHYISIENENWYESLPGFEVLTIKQIKERYKFDKKLKDKNGQLRGDIDQGKPFVSARIAFRPKSKENSGALAIQDAHGYIEIGIPERSGRWRIYSIGKFVWDNPGSGFKKLRILPQFLKDKLIGISYLGFLANTTRSSISTIDENRYKNHRQKAGYSFVIDKQEQHDLIVKIGKDISRTRKKDHDDPLPFSFTSRNCAGWVQETLDEVFSTPTRKFHNLFRVHPIKAEYPSPIKLLTERVHTDQALSPADQDKFYRKLAQLFFSGRSLQTKSGTYSVKSDWEQNPQIPIPAYLLEVVDLNTGSLKKNEEEEKKMHSALHADP